MKKTWYLGLTGSILVIVMGLGLLLYPKMTDLAYALSQKGLSVWGKDARASESGSKDGIPLPDEVVCKLAISKINLEANVLSGTDQSVLRKGPGHYEETPLPGEQGNCAIAGHRTMYGHLFRHIDRLDRGDEIVIYTRDGRYTYRIVEKRVVNPKDLSVIDQDGDTELTLTACHPVGSARQRIVIIAELEK